MVGKSYSWRNGGADLLVNCFSFPAFKGEPATDGGFSPIGGDWLYWVYAVILWCEMLTTLLANTYGVAQRLAASTGLKFRSYVIILTIIGILIGQIGFGKLVTKFYPLFGYFSLAVLLLLLKKTKKNLNF
jgi:uncharacterized membrane protein YkvI